MHSERRQLDGISLFEGSRDRVHSEIQTPYKQRSQRKYYNDRVYVIEGYEAPRVDICNESKDSMSEMFKSDWGSPSKDKEKMKNDFMPP